MIITLKNGRKIEPEWSFLVMQYLEDYEGGLKKLKKDMDQKNNLLKIQSLFIYAAVRANYEETITFQEAVKLVEFKDIFKINSFFKENLEKQEEFKKKESRYTPRKKKRKK